MSEKRREGCWSEKKSVGSGSSVFSSVSLKSDQSKGEVPNFIEIPPSSEGLLYESIHSDCQTIFKDLESKIFKYVKNQLNKFKKILRQENMRDFIKDFSEDRCRIKEAALDLTLYFLREMKQDEAADTLEDELIFINQLKCGLQKKYQCVFEGIAQQGDSTLLKNIYTDLYITQGGSEQVNTEHEVRQIEVTSRRHEAQEIQVECRHLFEASAQDKQIRTVMTKGVAGIGKSVSVQKFVLDWAEGKENQEISFIFPLPFREMNLKEKEKLSLMELITQFYPETKGLNLTRRNRYKVLFILDGLDECRLPLNFAGNETCRDVSSPASLDVLLTNLIRGNLLPSALIWITSRPAAASKIPPDCIDRVTEIRGFNDAQKEEYFRKRLTDENQVNKIIDHVKQSKSLFIMCHIPVFCWISATVLQNILQEKRNNDVKNNQADDASKTLQESNTEDTPKTLTQMYTHFLRFQIQQSRRKYNGEYTPDVFWDKDAILSLGKLAFQQLLNNNLIFYDTDLEACGIDVYKASDYSGMCTQIFKEEKGMILGTMYCFVHLSIQEFIAALNAHLILDINKKTVFDQDSTEQENRNESMIDLLKTAVDKALESDNGHLDLFLRFLLGLSLQSNRQLLRGLFTQQDHKKVDQQQAHNDQSKEEIVQYIKQKFEVNLSPERSINLFYCLNELNDQTLVKEIQSHLSKGSLSSADLSPAQWSALVFVLLTSHEEMEEFELQEFKKSDECLIRLSAVIKTTKKALLNDCNLTHRSCSALASVLRSDTSLKELNMSNNNLQDSGVKLLCTGLKDRCDLELLRLSKCDLTEKSCSALALVLRSDSSSLKDLDLSNNNLQDSGVKLLSDGLKDSKLEKLSLSDCSISEEGYKALASALRSNPSHLIELDLRGNDPGQSGVKELTDLQQDPHCTLKTLRFLSPAADEFCQFVSGIEGKNLLLLKELNLSDQELGDTRVNQLSALLQDKHCKLNTLILRNRSITEEQCVILTSALKSNPSHLRELNLSENQIRNTGVNLLCDVLKDSHCKLETLRLSKCGLTGESCSALASVLRSDSSSLKDLDLSNNNLQDSGVKLLSDGLKDSKLEKLNLSDCSIGEESYKALASALRSNPSHPIELDLRGNDPGQSGVKKLTKLLQDPHCTLKTLRFLSPAADEFCRFVSRIVGKNPLLLKELNLRGRKLGYTRVNQLSALLQDKHCKLNTLMFLSPAADEGCQFVTGIVGKNLLLVIELNLSDRKLGDTRVNQLSALLQDKHCRLNTLMLIKCDLTEKSCSALASVLRSDSSSLKDLDLSNNNLQDSGVKLLSDGLKDSKLEKLSYSDCNISEEGYKALASALRSNPSHLIELDLRGNDPGQSGVKELTDLLQDPHCTLKKLRFLSPTAEEGCQFVTGIVGKNPLLLKELNLSNVEQVDTGLNQLSALLQDKHCQINTLMLSKCDLTEESCSALASVLRSDSSSLKDLDLSNNNLQDSGVKLLSDGLKDSKLEKLSLSDCNTSEEGYKALASALRSNPSHLIELDLRGNDPGQSGVKELTELLQDPHCTLKTLRFLSPTADEGCQFVTRIVGKNPLFLTKLNLRGRKLGDTRVNQLSALLQDKHCKLNTLMLSKCDLREESCSALASVLRSDSSSLKDLDLSNNNLQDSGVKLLSDGLKDSKLEKLSYSDCNISEEGYKALASALRSNPSHLIELDLRGNDPGQSGVKELTDLLQDPHCTLKTLRFLSPTAEEGCQFVTGIVGKNLLLLKELNLSDRVLGDTRVNQLSALLQDKHCQINTLMLSKCDLTEESCSALASVLRSDSCSLKDLDLSNNNLQDSGVKLLSDGLKDSKLEKLSLSDCNTSEEGYKALASALRSNPSHLIELDLRGNDPGQSGVKELTELLQDPHCTLKKLRFLSPTADEGCQFVTRIVRKNPLFLTKLNLRGRKLGDTRVNQLSALLQDKHCKLNTLMLSKCDLREESCSALASVLRSDSSSLKDLDLSNNNLQDSGVKLLSDGLKDSKLEKLSLSDCNTSEEGYKALASALRSNPSHLIELDLRGNDPGQSGVKELTELLQDPHCTLKTLRFLSPTAEEGCQFVTGIVGENPLLLKELNLSDRELGDTRVNQLSALLQDKHCTLNTLILCVCRFTEKQCKILTSALKSNPSHLRELDLSKNQLNNTVVNHLCDVLKDSRCKLETLRLRSCEMMDESYSAVTSALKSNPSHLRELNLSENKLGDSAVKNLSDLLMNQQCKLEKLNLCVCRFSEEQCVILISALKSNPSHLRDLNLNGNQIKNTGVNLLCDVLKDSRCKLETLRLSKCDLTEESCSALALVLRSDSSSLKDLDLSNNNLQDSGVKRLSDVLKESKLEKLGFSECSISEEGYKALASALRSNPSHLIELDLRGNDPGQSGVKELTDLLQDPHCTLKTLRFLSPAADEFCQFVTGIVGENPLLLKELNLSDRVLGDTRVNQLSALLQDKHCRLNRLILHNCSITEEHGENLTSALKSNPSHLRELNLSGNQIRNTGVNLVCDVLKDSGCRLKRLRLSKCDLTEESCSALASVLRSDSSSLKDLDLSNNNLQDSGVKLLSDELKDSKLEKLSLSDCSISEEGYKALASALRSNPSHLIELDLRGNDPGQSGVKELTDLLQDPHCTLKTLRFLSPAADEFCQFVTGVVGENPLLLKELNLSERELGDTRVNQLSALLQDKHCRLNTLMLSKCDLTEESCSALASVLRSDSSSLKDLDLSNNNLQDSGVKRLSDGLKDSKLEILGFLGCSITEEGYKALASALKSNPSHLIELDLRGNDPGQSGVKELTDLLQDPHCTLKTLRFLSPAADEFCQFVTEIVGENPLLLTELNLSDHELGDTRVNQLSALLQDKHCKLNTLMLSKCDLTEESCSALASVLRSDSSSLKNLDLSNNNLQDSGVKLLSDGLKDSKLEKLSLSDCSISEEGYKALASALRSNPSHLIELDLRGNDPGPSGVKELTDLLQDPHCTLNTLRFLSPAADEGCQFVTGIVGENPLLLKELNLSDRELGDTRVNQLSALLQDKHCTLNTLMLSSCKITDEGYSAVTSALKSNPSHLRELNLRENKLGGFGVKNLSDLLMKPQFKLKILDLYNCSITEEQCEILTSALKSNPTNLRELNLSWNNLGDSGVKNLNNLLMETQFKLEKLHLYGCSITEKQCVILTSALKSNPSHLRELELSMNKLGDSAVKNLSDLLMKAQFKLEKLNLFRCSITEKQCVILTSALKSNPSHLRELDLSWNKLGPSAVKNLNDFLMKTQFKLEKLHLWCCSITEQQCVILTSALKSNPSHLRELNLSRNEIRNTGLNLLCDVLKDSQCKLEILSLWNCGITDVSSLTQCLMNTKALRFLKVLDLSYNPIGGSKQELIDVIQDSNCKLILK
ncbi:uncharacterized protein si:ch73-286h23.3 isoform X1 [Danio rerio]|uniref:Uncharacterized protein si:ch73-286h23.3 isoform X1 n=1 Tax=Danio rerio TaxID=7955 RepID=A0AC58IGP1_DANRE